jgi:hypothetical protein
MESLVRIIARFVGLQFMAGVGAGVMFALSHFEGGYLVGLATFIVGSIYTFHITSPDQLKVDKVEIDKVEQDKKETNFVIIDKKETNFVIAALIFIVFVGSAYFLLN